MSGRRVVILLLVLIGVTGVALFTIMISSNSTTLRRVIVMETFAAIALTAAIGAFVWRRRVGSRKRASAAQAAGRSGLSYREKAPRGFHHSFGALPGIPRGGEVTHVLTGALDGRALTIFQHLYMIHTGQASIPVHHVVSVTAAPPWPEMSILKRSVFDRLLSRFGVRRGEALEVEAFNRAYRVKADDADFALVLLSPPMQTFLAAHAFASWKILPGVVARIERGAMEFDRIDVTIEHLRAFWSLVPEELAYWTPAPSRDGGRDAGRPADQSGSRNPYR